jgi:hypothetical protein
MGTIQALTGVVEMSAHALNGAPLLRSRLL